MLCSCFVTTVSRKPLQPPEGLQESAMPLRKWYWCTGSMPAHVAAAFADPPEEPARRVVLLITPNSLNMAVTPVKNSINQPDPL